MQYISRLKSSKSLKSSMRKIANASGNMNDGFEIEEVVVTGYQPPRDYVYIPPIEYPSYDNPTNDYSIPSSPGGGGSNSNTNTTTVVVVLAPPKTIDLKKMLDCFKNIADNANTKYKVTLHVQLADPNYPSLPIVSDGSVGHAYLTLEKSNGNDKRTLSFGFYPRESSTSVPLKNSVASGIGEESSNTSRRSDIRYPKDVDQATFNQLINTATENSSKLYDLNQYNCTDYAVGVFNKAIPSHSIDVSGYTTPSNLYSKLKSMSSNYPIERSLNGWNNPRAPISSLPCN